METLCGKRWPTTRSNSSGLVARRRTIMWRFSTGCRRSTMAKTQRWWPSWRPWARPCHGNTSQPIPGSRNWRIGWSGWWHRQMLTIWQGRLEGLLARHWPEATQVLKLSSGTLLRVLKRYGTPQALAADGEAAKLLARWGGAFLAPEKIEQLLAGAGASVGVRLGEWQQRQIQNYAQQ